MNLDTDIATPREGMRSPTIALLAKALASAQGEIEDAHRDSENPFFRSSYADLASVWRACRKALSTHDLAVIQTTEPGVTLLLRTTLAHASGEWICGLYPIRPMKQAQGEGWIASDDPQSSGSALTYARRYALAAIVGVAPADDDDDGESAMQRRSSPETTAAEITMRFGSGAGKTPAQLDDKDLGWYLRAFTRDVQNPEKAKYRTANQRTLDALEAERAQRQIRSDDPPPPQVDADTGEIFDRLVPPETPGSKPPGAAARAEAITEPQVKRLWAISREQGWSQGDVKDLLTSFGVEHTKEIPRDRYETVVNRIKAERKAPPSAPTTGA